MFGLKKYNKAKSKSFASDKERKKYFAIQNYYKNKNNTSSSKTTTKSKNQP